jgi:hypothetical protein
MPADQRKIVGSTVHALACHVTALSECTRRYGSNNKKKLLDGVVIRVETKPTPTGRTSTIIVANYKLGSDGVTKLKGINIRSVKAGAAPVLSGEEDDTEEDTFSVPVNIIAVPARRDDASIDTSTAVTASVLASVQRDDDDDDDDDDYHPPPDTDDSIIPNRPEDLPALEYDYPRAAAAAAAPVQGPGTTAPVATTTAPVATVHEQEWFKPGQGGPIKLKKVPPRQWKVKNQFGDEVYPNSPASLRMSRLDFFLLMFPEDQLTEMIVLTNRELRKRGAPDLCLAELLKFFGILLLATRFEFGSRAELWSTTAPSKYRPAPAFGTCGMSRKRFDVLFTSIKWSDQPDERPDDMTSEAFRWQLVKDFVNRFNVHRATRYFPSESICVDESISRWYGLGGYWINIGIPQYVAIDRKPENGCEIQNAADGVSGVMMQLKLVETAESEVYHVMEGEDGLLHGTVVLKRLLQPWAGKGDRVVCADSYFASVGAAEELEKMGLGFIGVVKTATKRFPTAYLSAIELHNRGDFRGVYTKDANGDAKAMAFVWMDRDRRYFIATRSSLDLGEHYARTRWRQVDQTRDADPERVDLEIPQPLAAEVYYKSCASIDRHNRSRQDDLMLETKVETKDWSVRVNLSLFGMCVIDAYYVAKGCRVFDEKPAKFFEGLAEELIDNTYGTRGTRQRPRRGGATSPANNRVVATAAHLTPTKRKRKDKTGQLLRFSLQGRCKVCQKKTSYICSLCKHEQGPDVRSEPWLCHHRNGGRDCFDEHCRDVH